MPTAEPDWLVDRCTLTDHPYRRIYLLSKLEFQIISSDAWQISGLFEKNRVFYPINIKYFVSAKMQ